MKNTLAAWIATSTLAIASPVLPAYAGIQDFRVHNLTTSSIVHLHISNSYGSGSEDWGPNVLNSSLPSGWSTYITFPSSTQNCYFDILAEFRNGVSQSYFRVNLCSVSDVYFP